MILESEDAADDSSCAVCIVGAGLAGIYLAAALRELGLEVMVLERGGRAPIVADSSSVEFASSEYEGATTGRYFGLGGTSAAWGGQLAPMAPHELTESLPGQPEPWPFALKELTPHYGSVLARYGLGSDSLAQIWRGSESSATRMNPPTSALSLKTSARNAARLWGSALESSALRVVLNSQVQSISSTSTDGAKQVRELTFATASGAIKKVRFRALAVCAGALESTRIYQRLFEAPEKHAFQSGTTLQDHLSVTIGSLEIRDLEGFRDRFSPRISPNGILFGRVFCSRGPGLPSGFLHAVYAEKDGFQAWLHDVLRSAQNGDARALFRRALHAPRFVKSAAALASGYVFRRRVEWPATTKFDLLLDVEQLPDRFNEVRESDAGKLRVKWRASEADSANIAQFAHELRDEWENSDLRHVARIVPERFPAARARVAFHPTGTLRMASNSTHGAVDADCRPHGFSNAFILTTAVFPRCGAANPSFTLLALAERASTQIKESVR